MIKFLIPAVVLFGTFMFWQLTKDVLRPLFALISLIRLNLKWKKEESK